MPDLFDNFFGRISTTMNGGKSKPRYNMSSQVNTGAFYRYHTNGTNNNSWLPNAMNPLVEKDMEGPSVKEPKARMGSVASMSTTDSSNSMDE